MINRSFKRRGSRHPFFWGSSDLVLALLVLTIIAMLLVPLPTWLLDLLLASNISISLLLLLVGLYMPNALALLVFPTILLLTTLFRLSLNVASTRLILSSGDAGRVIEAFGTFLIRGDVLVGFIIFIIITVVNFIVIAKGAGRVSEVAARFSLDALPGRQMAIDVDLRNNTISAEDAKRLREELRKESQLYGAMDGAMKFVQGDAIAGFFIAAINIVGGIYQGLNQGLSIPEAVNTYTVLTVGDGLVSQIPALLISICAGIVVTRVSSGDRATLGSDVEAQLFGRPVTLLFVSVLTIAIGLLPGVPAVPFLAMGAVAALTAYLGWKGQREELTGSAEEASWGLVSGSATSLALIGAGGAGSDSSLVLELGGDPRAFSGSSSLQHAVDFWDSTRAAFNRYYGCRLPELAIRLSEALPPLRYRAVFERRLIDSGAVPHESLFVECRPCLASVIGLEFVAEGKSPLTGATGSWIVDSALSQALLKAGNLRALTPLQYLQQRSISQLLRNAEDLISSAELHLALKEVQQLYPGFVEEVLKDGFVTLSRLTEIFKGLVRDGVSLSNIRKVLESVMSYTTTLNTHTLSEVNFNLWQIIAFVRREYRAQLTTQLLSARGVLRVVIVDETVEEVLRDAIGGVSVGSLEPGVALSAESYQSLVSSLRETESDLANRGILPVALLCDGDIRPQLATFIAENQFCFKVLSFEEVDPLVRVEQVGRWEVLPK